MQVFNTSLLCVPPTTQETTLNTADFQEVANNSVLDIYSAPLWRPQYYFCSQVDFGETKHVCFKAVVDDEKQKHFPSYYLLESHVLEMLPSIQTLSVLT